TPGWYKTIESVVLSTPICCKISCPISDCNEAKTYKFCLSFSIILLMVVLQKLHTPSNSMICFPSGIFIILFFPFNHFKLFNRNFRHKQPIIDRGYIFFNFFNRSDCFSFQHSYPITYFQSKIRLIAFLFCFFLLFFYFFLLSDLLNFLLDFLLDFFGFYLLYFAFFLLGLFTFRILYFNDFQQFPD